MRTSRQATLKVKQVDETPLEELATMNGDKKFLKKVLGMRGAEEVEKGQKVTLKDVREMEVEEAVLKVCGWAQLESTKRQYRTVLRQFTEFQKGTPEESLALKVVKFLQHQLKSRPAIRRVSTLHQMARVLQYLHPEEKILKSPIYLAYLKGLGRVQPIAARVPQAASSDQLAKFTKAAGYDQWTMSAALMIARAAARLSDIRAWIGGRGRLMVSREEKSITLLLEYRKTDQAGTAPMPHVVGPVGLTKEEWGAFDWVNFQGQKLKDSRWTAWSFLQALQRAKKKAGIKSFIECRRGRARIAAKKATLKEVGQLLGHKEGSSSTARYTQTLDYKEWSRRMVMTTD